MSTNTFKSLVKTKILTGLLFILALSSCTLTRTASQINDFKSDKTDVFLSENEINKAYKVIGFVQYERANVGNIFTGIATPVFSIAAPTLTKAKKSVARLQRKAKSMGGDAIIMTTMYSAKVIKY